MTASRRPAGVLSGHFTFTSSDGGSTKRIFCCVFPPGTVSLDHEAQGLENKKKESWDRLSIKG